MQAYRKLLYIAFTLLLSLGGVSYTLAQSTGIIRGTVTDPSGAAIPNASVTANSATSIARAVATNDSGIFVFPEPAYRHLFAARSPQQDSRRRIAPA